MINLHNYTPFGYVDLQVFSELGIALVAAGQDRGLFAGLNGCQRVGMAKDTAVQNCQ